MATAERRHVCAAEARRDAAAHRRAGEGRALDVGRGRVAAGAKVTAMRPAPVGPSAFLHDCAAPAAAVSAESAAVRSKSAPPRRGGGSGAGAAAGLSGAGAGAGLGRGGRGSGFGLFGGLAARLGRAGGGRAAGREHRGSARGAAVSAAAAPAFAAAPGPAGIAAPRSGCTRRTCAEPAVAGSPCFSSTHEHENKAGDQTNEHHRRGHEEPLFCACLALVGVRGRAEVGGRRSQRGAAAMAQTRRRRRGS